MNFEYLLKLHFWVVSDCYVNGGIPAAISHDNLITADNIVHLWSGCEVMDWVRDLYTAIVPPFSLQGNPG